MQISALLIGIVLLAVAVFYISLPFRHKRRRVSSQSKVDMSPKSRHEEILLALRDLEFDFKTGKVSDEDYQPLHAQLMVEAAQYMESQTEEDEQLEVLIQSRRKAKSTNLTCEHCGAPVKPGQRFCSKCGASASVSCSSCGKQIRAGDAFCSSCGTKVEVRMEAVAQ